LGWLVSPKDFSPRPKSITKFLKKIKKMILWSRQSQNF
jgi:hypothetical protein